MWIKGEFVIWNFGTLYVSVSCWCIVYQGSLMSCTYSFWYILFFGIVKGTKNGYWFETVLMSLCLFFFLFFFRARQHNCPGWTTASGLLCNPKILHSAQIQQPCVSNKEAEVPNWGCAYVFWFDNLIPKDIEAPTSQHLAVTDNLLHCFGILPAESAGRIPLK
jgi:hypothetical protein